jgi:NAD-dependent SIR2 family protein deacetylase
MTTPTRENKVAVLLGAGASVDAGLPTSLRMTDAVIELVDFPAEHRRMISFIRHTLEADAALRRLPVSVDVERLFAAVELLINRSEQPWSPFVAGWHHGLDSPTLISERTHHDVDELLRLLREDMLDALMDILWIGDTSAVRYLAPLFELARYQGVLTIATLNYDRSVELAAEHEKFPYDTGIDTWLLRGHLDWPATGIRLLKLHGSIDWVIERRAEQRSLPLHVIEKRTDANPPMPAGGEELAILFGEGGKLRAEGPFIELLLAWSTQLREADSLVIVGYSFRDHHINETIARWFDAVETNRIVVVDPGEYRVESLFGWTLNELNEEYLDDVPGRLRRVHHLRATASDALPEAIAIARSKP